VSKCNPGASIVAKLLPENSIGVEIGVWRGDSSVEFLERAAFLHLVDPWPDRESQYREVAKRFKGIAVAIHYMTSAEFFECFKDVLRVDWVYIDGLHDYGHVKADLIGARSILKPGGVIYGDDYGKKEGVKEAVDEICPHRRLLGLSQYEIT
jgi:hypothetical protein